MPLRGGLGAAALFMLWWCPRSQFGQILPRPDPRQSIALHDEEFFGGVSGGPHAPGRHESFRDRLRIGVAHRIDHSRPLSPESVHELAGRRPAAICDVGCGNGEVLARLQALGHTVLGIEPALVARRNAAALGVPVTDGTAEHPGDVPSASFDIVIARHSLEHCTDPILAFRNLADLVKPGGRLICATPNCESLGFKRSGAAWWHSDVPRHLSFFTQRSLSELCRRNGLTVEGVQYYGFVRQFTPGWITTEQQLWDRFFAGPPAEPPAPPPDTAPLHLRTPRRPGPVKSWLRLARALIAQDRLLYDSVKIIARRPSERRIAA